MDRAIVEWRDDLEHERDRCYALTDSLRKHRIDHETDRDEYVVAWLQVERDVRSIVGELETACGEILRLKGDISDERIQVERLERERKNLLDVLECGAIYIVRRGLVLTVRAETPHVERRMRVHLTWKLDRVCVALSEQHTKGTDIIGQ